MKSFFDPNIILPNGKSYKQFRYEQILNKEAQIAYGYSGGVTVSELDEYTEYDLDILLDTLMEIREMERYVQEKAINPNKASAHPPRKSRFTL